MQEQWGEKTWKDACRVLGDRMRQDATGSKKSVRGCGWGDLRLGGGGGCSWAERGYQEGLWLWHVMSGCED